MTAVEIQTMTDEELRGEVRTWLDANWDNSFTQITAWDEVPEENRQWFRKVLEARWAVPTWPVEYYGRGMSNEQAKVIEAEFKRAGAPGAGQDRTNLSANTVLTFGTATLKAAVLPQLLCGEAKFCLLYSEPGAGSDLAAVRTRADLKDGKWIVNGQKVWTSGAMTADYGLLVARTDWDAPKHQGISFFLCPMRQPGVTVRPLHQITDESHFNEVFLDNAEIPQENLMGALNQGWKVLQTALAYERSIMGEGAGSRQTKGGAKGLIELARKYGCIDDPIIRQDLANAIGFRQLNDLNNARAKAELAQGTSSPIMSLGKLAMSRILHGEARVETAILGTASLINGAENPDAVDNNFRAFIAYMTSIGGGTDQIQRNIIGERVLGLPREVELDRDIPFRESKSG